MLSALDIKKKEFEQKMRGYDVDEVRKFLDDVAKEFELLVRDEISLEDELEDTKKKLTHYLSLESTLEKTLLAAQQTAMKMEEQAKKEAELILQEARMERDKMLREIPMEIERARSETIRLKAEYESTLTRMKAMMEGFKRFVEEMGESNK
ncbi:MAG: DivIVA domain-containing protein [Bacteroidota bacterium]|nr:DivIVA domain-containing protein [Bacteroidota bacterium]MDP4229411.1 DivIVA domain-containing protein [Bacteroidota bacterium]MDP4237039.1 DivIVA domain-containing protein [Bacteroidota bacterium]